jgi:hypothetical protein
MVDPERLLDVDRDFADVCSLLPADYRELAVTLGAIQPGHVNARIKSADDLLRCVLLHVAQDLPLRATAAVIAETCGLVVSPYCLHIRMRASGAYLGALVASMFGKSAPSANETFAGYDLVAVDATAFSGRRASGTDARIHAAIRLADLRVVEATAFGVEVAESFRRFQWREGQLAIGDRGYCNTPSIAWVVDHGADVLVRFNRGSTPTFDRSGAPIDLLPWVRPLAIGEIAEQRVRIRGTIDRKERWIEGRLVATRLPDDKAEEARQRVRDELGKKASPASLEMASFVVLFTTSELSAAQCFDVYRLRWQIELLFKRWKSLCHFDKLPNERADTILSWVTAKLLLGLIVDRLAGAEVGALSPRSPASVIEAA